MYMYLYKDIINSFSLIVAKSVTLAIFIRYNFASYRDVKSAATVTICRTQHMGLFSPNAEGFMMIGIQHVCGKASLMCLIPILVGVIYDGIICPKTSLRVQQ